MRTLRRFVLSATAGASLILWSTPLSAQTEHESTNLERRFARHFSEQPPVSFELVESADHRPFIVITNLLQYPLTAYVVQTEPKSAADRPQTLIHDALMRMDLIAPVPRGLSHKIGVPQVGELVPGVKLVAAVWEDGSTFGPDELLARISASRKAMADSYDLAIATLKTGLAKNWTAEEYLIAAQQLKTPMPAKQMATRDEAIAASEKFVPQPILSYTITSNMQQAIEHDRSPTRVAKLVENLLKNFEQSRNALHQALIGTS
jgi:hypothetical protein